MPSGTAKKNYISQTPLQLELCEYGSPKPWLGASLVAQAVKCLTAMWETWVQSLGREYPLEEEMATHSNTLAWRIRWNSMDRGVHGMAKSWTRLSDFTSIHGSEVKVSPSNVGDLGSISGLGRSPGEGNGNPLQYSCLENPMDREAW